MAAEITPETQDVERLGVYTETLARLYWRQGYLDKALQIYRHLAAEQPAETHFQDQVRALVQQLDAPPDGSAPDASAERSDAVQLGAQASAVGSAQTQQVVAQLERWLSCLQQRHHGMRPPAGSK